MNRKALTIAAALTVSLVACQGPEHLILKKYFNAVAFKDKMTLASIAVEPTAPNVTKWEVVAVGEERTEVAQLKPLAEAEAQAKAKLDELKGRAREAQGANDAAKAALDAAARKDKATAQAAFDESKAAYENAIQAVKDAQKAWNSAKEATALERKITTLSAGELPQLDTMDGEFRTKDVTVKLTAKAEDGTETEKDYVITMRAYKMKNPATTRTHRGKWIILKLQPQS